MVFPPVAVLPGGLTFAVTLFFFGSPDPRLTCVLREDLGGASARLALGMRLGVSVWVVALRAQPSDVVVAANKALTVRG